jgi:hypothetical protein
MPRIESMFVAATAVVVLGGASAAAADELGVASRAAAATAIDVPAQVFPHDQTSPKPVIEWTRATDAATRERNGVAGRSLRVDLPLGAGARAPVMFHIFSSEDVCHDNMDFTASAAARNQEQDFIRGGDH